MAFAVSRTSRTGPIALSGGGKMKAVKGIVVHHTGPASSVDAVIDALISRTADGTAVGATYVMDRDGSVYRIVPEGARTNHAKGYNANYEGIEVIAKNDGDITPQQVAAFRQFAEWHAGNYGYTISPTSVLAHGDIASYKRQTEGATLKWSLMTAEGYDVPAGVMVGDLGDGTPATAYADAPAWVRRPPLNIPTVASELDTGMSAAPRPMPYATRFGALGQVEQLRAEELVRRRAELLNSAAAYGVRVGGSLLVTDEALAMTPGMQYAGGPQGVVADPRLMDSLLRSQDMQRLDPIGPGPTSWFPDMAVGGIGSTVLTGAGAAIGAAGPQISIAAPAATAEADPVGSGAGSWGDFTRALAVPLRAPAPLVAPPREPTPNSRDGLDAFVRSVYAGILPLDAKDDTSEEVAPAAPYSLTSPASVAQRTTLSAPRLTNSIIFDPAPLGSASSFSTNYAGMAMAFDTFTLPPDLAPKISYEPPKLDWLLLDSPNWNDSMERREERAKSSAKPAPAAAVKAPTVDETRAEQRQARQLVAAQPSTATVKTPTKPGVTGVVAAPTPAPRPIAIGAPLAGATGVPASKPATRTIQLSNPAYEAWEAKYGGGTVGGPGYDGVGLGPGSFADFQKEMGLGKESPVVPPAPARYITKTVAAPTPRTKPIGGVSPAGSYTIQPGDTLSAIARRSGLSVAELARLNNIADPNKIVAGAKLNLGGGSSIPVASTSKGAAAATAASSASAASKAASSTSVKTVTGSSTGKQYVVGQVYVTSKGVQKMAMPDGTFKAI
jgi:LysM repeat protein